MEDSLKAAILAARAAEVNAIVAGMIAENQHRVACGNSIAYGYEAFEALTSKYGIGYNDIAKLVIHNEL